jgi:hypothetical protein
LARSEVVDGFAGAENNGSRNYTNEHERVGGHRRYFNYIVQDRRHPRFEYPILVHRVGFLLSLVSNFTVLQLITC